MTTATKTRKTKTSTATKRTSVIQFLDYADIQGHQFRIGPCKLTLELLRHLAKLNVKDETAHQRKIHWSHVSALMENMIEGRWRWSACVFSVSWLQKLIDGQHRILAMLYLYGTDDDRQWILTNFYKESKDGKPVAAPRNLAKLEKHFGKEIDGDEYIIVAENCDPENFKVYDTDLLKRTGADLLGMDVEIDNWCTETGVSANFLGSLLRGIHLRVTPGKDYKGDGGVYGYMAKGGRISPEKYIEEFWPTYGRVIQLAHNLILDCMTPKDRDAFTWGEIPSAQLPMYIATVLYLMSIEAPEDEDTGGKPYWDVMGDEDIPQDIADNVCRVVQDATRYTINRFGDEAFNPGGVFKLWNNEAKGWKAGHRLSAIIHSMNTPKVETTLPRWLKILGDNPEQQSAFRFPGPDSTTRG